MKHLALAAVALALALVATAAAIHSDSASAQVDAAQFATARQTALYGDLIGELRCLVCANQSLADSDSDLAQDLRGKVREMVAQGRRRGEIIDYMVARYGEYVLYRPRLTPATAFLWLAPFILLPLGLGVIWRIAMRKLRQQPDPYSAKQVQQARALIEDDSE